MLCVVEAPLRSAVAFELQFHIRFSFVAQRGVSITLFTEGGFWLMLRQWSPELLASLSHTWLPSPQSWWFLAEPLSWQAGISSPHQGRHSPSSPLLPEWAPQLLTAHLVPQAKWFYSCSCLSLLNFFFFLL